MIDERAVKSSVAEILDVDPAELSPDTALASFGSYDSTAQLSLMVCLADFSSREFGLADIRALTTFGDVLTLLHSS